MSEVLMNYFLRQMNLQYVKFPVSSIQKYLVEKTLACILHLSNKFQNEVLKSNLHLTNH